MQAAYAFMKAVAILPAEILCQTAKLNVHLYGSLSATGKGHGTDKAITAGLLGVNLDTCDANFILNLWNKEEDEYKIKMGDKILAFKQNNIIFEPPNNLLKYQNTLKIKLLDKSNKELFSKIYYSIGGGFILCEGEQEKVNSTPPPYCFLNMEEFKCIYKKTGLSAIEILRENEKTLTGLNNSEINHRLDRIIDTMTKTVERGLNTTGVLPGKLCLERKAPDLYKMTQKNNDPFEKKLLCLNSFAFAASEENAAGRIIVTAPTSGASGTMASIIYYLLNYRKISRAEIRNGLLIAGLLGCIAKTNASISGAEVGCQGEVGVASAMGAGLISYINKCNLQFIENAAEIALEHHLGMTCDPIEGYVQIPCIERNAVGAVTAYNAYIIAEGICLNKQKIGFDEVLKAMLKTGQDMGTSYKETSRSGLASCSLCC